LTLSIAPDLPPEARTMALLAFARTITQTIMVRSFSIPMATTSKLSVTRQSDGRLVLLDLMLWVVAVMDDGEP
jgi:hypothetical protein